MAKEEFNWVARRTILSNGIELASQNHSNSGTDFSMMIDAGSAQDPAGQDGLVHLLEHLVVTPKLEKGFEQRGGYITAQIDGDRMHVYGKIEEGKRNLTFLSKSLLEVLTADIQQNRFFYHERDKVIRNEIGREMDNPQKREVKLSTELFRNGRSPYGNLGTSDTLSEIDAAQLNQFKRKWFVGKNVVIAVTGALEHHDFHEKLDKALSDVQAGPKPRKTKPQLLEGHSVRVDNDALHQLYFDVDWPIPSCNKKQKAIASIVQIIVMGRVDKSLRGKLGAYEAYAHPYAHAQRNGVFVVRGNIAYADAKGVLPAIAKLMRAEITQKEFELSKKSVSSFMNVSPMPDGGSWHGAEAMASELIETGSISSYERVRARYDSVTIEDVSEFMNELLQHQPSVSTYGNDKQVQDIADFHQRLNCTM